MAELHLPVHIGTTKVKVAILEAKFLVCGCCILIKLERKCLCRIQDAKRDCFELNCSGREEWIFHSFLTIYNLCGDGQRIFATNFFCIFKCGCGFRIAGWVADNLNNASSVTQINEDNLSMITDTVCPSVYGNRRPDVLNTDIPTTNCSLPFSSHRILHPDLSSEDTDTPHSATPEPLAPGLLPK